MDEEEERESFLEMRHEWPFETSTEEIAAYQRPSKLWETLRLSNAGVEHQLPMDVAGLDGMLGSLDMHGACTVRGDMQTASACANLTRALTAEPVDAVVKGVAQRFPCEEIE